MAPCAEGSVDVCGKKWDFGRELNEREAVNKAVNMGQQRAGGPHAQAAGEPPLWPSLFPTDAQGPGPPAPIRGQGRGHVGRETLKPPGSGTCLQGRASVPTHSVWSLGRHWNADLPTDWMGLS